MSESAMDNQEPLLLTAWRRCNEFAAEHNISYVMLCHVMSCYPLATSPLIVTYKLIHSSQAIYSLCRRDSRCHCRCNSNSPPHKRYRYSLYQSSHQPSSQVYRSRAQDPRALLHRRCRFSQGLWQLSRSMLCTSYWPVPRTNQSFYTCCYRSSGCRRRGCAEGMG